MTPPTSLSDLEKKAKAATPGPWRHAPEGQSSTFRHVFAGTDDGPGQTVAQWTLPHDAAYIASASPDVILRLIRVARAAEKCTPRWRRFGDRMGMFDITPDVDVQALIDAVDALQESTK